MSSTVGLEEFIQGHRTYSVLEPFNDDGTFGQSVFFDTTGTAYIATALRAARAADPNTKLYVR
jgi:endo-1,4-beta-xylanase